MSEQPTLDESRVVDFAGQVKSLGLKQPFETSEGWDHQLVSRYQLIRNKRVILSVDKGLGKTWTILSIFEDHAVNKGIPGFTVLILCPEKGMGSFTRDIKKFPEWKDKIQLVYGQRAQRERQWKNSTARYFICTYASYLADLGVRTNDRKTGATSTPIVPTWAINGQIDGVVFDEFHKQFRRHQSKAFQTFAKLFRKTEYVFPMSGSAVSRGPEDLWAALHIVNPTLWSSYWKYVYTWCEVNDTPFGKSVKGPKLLPNGQIDQERAEKWRAAVRPYVVHIKDYMVKGMPPKNRDFLDVQMPPWQRQLHDSLLNQMYVETPDGDFIFATNTLTKINKLRQVLICPKVLSPEYGVGQGIEDIADDALDGGVSAYAIFTPFKAPIPLLADWLKSRGARVWILQGGIGLDEQTRRIDEWRLSLKTATPENPSIILGTILYAESWEVPECRYGYLLGYEWDPEANRQAEDRLRRLISVGLTYIRYCRHLGGYDENIIDLLVTKNINVTAMFKTWSDVKPYILRAA